MKNPTGYMKLLGCMGAGGLAATFFIPSDRKHQNSKSGLGPLVDVHDKQYDLPSRIERANEILRRFQICKGVPGVSVCVSVDGEGVWRGAVGVGDVENLQPLQPHSLMRIASIAKPITMAIVAKLMEEGKLDIDAPIQKYIEFPQKKVDGEEVTITTRQLLSHLGGIRHYNENKVITEADKTEEGVESLMAHQNEYFSTKQYNTIAEAMDVFKNDDLLHKPGSKFLYTTYGWTVISGVVEGAGKEKFTNQLKKLLNQFGMNHTYLDENTPIIANRARYYVFNPKHELQNVPEVNCSNKWAGGGLLSSVDDLVRFGNIMLYSYQYNRQTLSETDTQTQDKDSTTDSTKITGYQPFLKSETVAKMWEPVKSTPKGNKYGHGWGIEPKSAIDIGPKSDQRFFWDRRGYVVHTGGAVGASSVLLVKPTPGRSDTDTQLPKGVCVAVLTNIQECGGLVKLAAEIAEQFL